MSDLESQRISALVAEAMRKLEAESEPTPAAPAYGAYHQAAAVLASFDSGSIQPFGTPLSDEDDVDNLLVDCTLVQSAPGVNRFALLPDIRQDVLRQMGSRERMLQALEANPGRPDDPLQAMFEIYLRGDEEYPLENQDISQLAASLQVLAWLGGVLPDLPSLEAVRQRHEKLSLLQPFKDLAGERFYGREQELERLRDYVGVLPPGSWKSHIRRAAALFRDLSKTPPLVIYGIGGQGKSSLVARFIWEHATVPDSEQFPWIYLDYDRPSNWPKDPLSLLIEGVRQLGIQYTEARPFTDHLLAEWNRRMARLVKKWGPQRETDRDEWFRFLKDFSNLVQNIKIEEDPLLFVLDTFELVQYHGEAATNTLIEFLEIFQKAVPRLRIVISGRERLGVRYFTRNEMELGDLPEKDAQAFLEGYGVKPPAVAKILARQVGGNPLVLKLAVKAWEMEEDKEGGIPDLTRRGLFGLRRRKNEVQGLLFERILWRIQNERVHDLAYPGLALRRITPEIIQIVLAEPCKVPVKNIQEAQDLFDEMCREVWLVTREGEALRHNRDLRKIMLLLLHQRKDEVAVQIHKAAVAYYEPQDDPEARAEEIYHRLLLRQDPSVLDERWGTGERVARDHLFEALDELDLRERAWLKQKLGISLTLEERNQSSLQAWERETARAVADLLDQQKPEQALVRLKEKKKRTPGSELFSLEARAWQMQGEWSKSESLIREGIEKAAEGENLQQAILLRLLLARQAIHLQQVETARQMLAEAEELAGLRDEDNLTLISIYLERLALLRSQPTPAEIGQVQLLEKQLTQCFARLSDEQVIAHPQLLGRLAGELGEQYPEVLWRVIRLDGIVSDRLDLLRALGRALADWDQQLSREQKQAPGMLARLLGIPPADRLSAAWQSYLQKLTPADLTGTILRLKERYTNFPKTVRAALANLLSTRWPALVPEQAVEGAAGAERERETTRQATLSLRLTNAQRRELANSLMEAFSLNELRELVNLRLDVNLDVITFSADLRTSIYNLIQYADQQGRTAELLLAALDSRPNDITLQMLAGQLGLAVLPDDEQLIEKLIGTEEFWDVTTINTRLGQLGRLQTKICRVEIVSGKTTDYGTGFLVAPDLVLTAYHLIETVIRGESSPQDIRLRFDYRLSEDGVVFHPGTVFDLAQDWLRDYSPCSAADLPGGDPAALPAAGELDYALLRLRSKIGYEAIGGERAESSAAARGWINLPEQDVEANAGERLFILHHSLAGPAKVSLGTILGWNPNRTRLFHNAPTEPGSDGAPCFNERWELVAMQHAGDQEKNVAIPLGAVSDEMEKRRVGGIRGPAAGSRQEQIGVQTGVQIGAIKGITGSQVNIAGGDIVQSVQPGPWIEIRGGEVFIGGDLVRGDFIGGDKIRRQETDPRELLDRGDDYLERGESQLAQDQYQRALAAARRLGERELEAEVLFSLGRLFYFSENPSRAREYFEQALAISRELGDRSNELYCLDALGRSDSALGEYETALDTYQQVYALAQSEQADEFSAIALHNMGEIHASLGNYERAVENFQKALEMHEKTDDTINQALALYGLATVSMEMEDYDPAEEYLQRALQLFKRLEDLPGQAECSMQLGWLYEQRGDLSQATEYYQRALEAYSSAEDVYGQANALNSLGMAHAEQGDYAQSQADYQKALALAREVQDQQMEAELLWNLGLAQETTGDTLSAVASFEDSLVIQADYGDSELDSRKAYLDRYTERHFSVDLLDQDVSQPLPLGKAFQLAVSVDTLSRQAAMELEWIPPEGYYRSEEIRVLLSSQDFSISPGDYQMLRVPPYGRSASVIFSLVPLRPGVGTVSALFYKDNNIIQSLRLRLNVDTGTSALASLESSGRPVFAAEATRLPEVKPRDLLLLIQKGETGYECTLTGALTIRGLIPLSADEIAALVKNARQAWLEVVNLSKKQVLPYRQGLDIPAELNRQALERLAKTGYELFKRLFGSDDRARPVGEALLKLAGEQPLKIQVVSDELFLPWGLLYLAQQFDAGEIDPSRFLGWDNILEVLPLRAQMQVFDSRIHSQPVLNVSLNGDPTIEDMMGGSLLEQQQEVLGSLAKMGGVRLVKRLKGIDLISALRRPDTPDQILVYFGMVGVSPAQDRAGLSWLSFSDRQVVLDDLWSGLQQRKLANAPLVILNACDSAELDPTFYQRIAAYLDAVGARGLLGSEGEVPALFAAEWGRRFFQRFLVEGLPVGEVLRLLRKEFYAEHNNLLGLLYALYCDSDTRIVPPLQAL